MLEHPIPSGAIADAHVHLYDCYAIQAFISGAHDNLCAAAKQMGFAGHTNKVLMLTETDREHGFERLAEAAGGPNPNGSRWRFETLPADPHTLCALGPDGSRVIIIAGRQAVSEEGLEVLALGTRAPIRQGLALTELVDTITRHDAIPVIPWGVGKWLGRRGRIVKSSIESGQADSCYLGDILGHPWFWPRSGIFDTAKTRGIRVLPGTDPLPLESEARRVGCCGFHIDCTLPNDRPGSALIAALRLSDTTIRPFSQRESASRFVRNQLRLRLRSARNP